MKRTASDGFTLLEIVVAVVILSMGLAAAVQVFSSGFNNIRKIDMAHRAMNHAENIMNEILSDQNIRTPTSTSGDLDEDFSYTATVDYWQEPEDKLSINVAQPSIYLLKVVVEIHFKNDRHGKLYRTSSLKAVSEQTLDQQGTPADAIHRLFGGRR